MKFGGHNAFFIWLLKKFLSCKGALGAFQRVQGRSQICPKSFQFLKKYTKYGYQEKALKIRRIMVFKL